MTARDALVMAAAREADPDRYLSALYAPEAKRPALFALYAFNAEIASIRDRVRDALPGEVRLQWWQEVIDNHGGRAADGHPVAEALLAAISEHGLPRAAFANYLDARLFELFNDPMPSRADLEGYCGETASAIIQLASLVLDPKAAANSADLAGHAGCAQAITGLLRLLPLHLARRQCFVPRDILAAVGTTPDEFLARRDPERDGRVVDAMIALAREHMAAFRCGASAMEVSLRPAFLPAALVPAYLTAPSRRSGAVEMRLKDIAAWRRHWLLFRAAARGL